MAKVILSSALACFAIMTFFASAAEACISCEHVPMVVRGALTSDSVKRSKKKRAYRSTRERKTRAIKKRAVKRKPTAKKLIVKRKPTAKKRIVKRKSTAKKVETAKIAPIKSETESENSTISTGASLGNSYNGCRSLSVGCVVINSGPSEMTENLGQLSVPEFSQLASDERDSPTLTRGAFGNNE